MAIFGDHSHLVFAFGILGNIVSTFVYFAPLPAFMEIYRRKSTLGYQSVPYVVALFSAMLWMYYAFMKSNALLLISINSLGCVIETIYIVFFLAYASKEARKQTAKLIALLNVGLFSLILLLTVFLVQGPKRVFVVGWACVAVSVSVFAAPLSIVFQVVRTRSVEYMPFTLSFFLTLSAVMWFAYGLLTEDLCVALPNIVGFFLGILQMVLYGLYRKAEKKPVTEKKLPEHVINMATLSAPEVHPVDSHTSSDKDEKEEEEQQSIRAEIPDESIMGEPQPEPQPEPCKVDPLPVVSPVPVPVPVLVVCAA